MAELLEKAVWLPDLVHIRKAIRLLGELYDRDTWVGGMVFTDTHGGFLFIATFDPERYTARDLPFEIVFSDQQLQPATMEEACTNGRRFRPWLAGDVCTALRGLRLLPA